MSLSHYEPGQGENNTHNMSCVGHYLSLPSRSPSSLFVWLAVDLHWHCGSCFPIKLSSSKNTRLSMDKKKQLTPELGYAVQPSSAVATRVSITVSAAKREKSQSQEKKMLFWDYSFHRVGLHSSPSDHLTRPSMKRKGDESFSVSSISARLLLRQETRERERGRKKSLGILLEGMSESLCHAVKC